MKYTQKEADSLFDNLNMTVSAMGMSILELSISAHKNSIQAKLTLYKGAAIGKDSAITIEELSKVHRMITPRLEIIFPEKEIYIEVSSPGIDRNIKDGNEFPIFMGRHLRCYCTDINEWRSGVLVSCDETHIEIKNETGDTSSIPLSDIAKAKLDSFLDVKVR
ncbi:MAG: ribosome maturation factor RimP [Termitinemataceae bacterium]|nr:MAG: ribosome maturation factor RimP [Termitinemataceae bacterium]